MVTLGSGPASQLLLPACFCTAAPPLTASPLGPTLALLLGGACLFLMSDTPDAANDITLWVVLPRRLTPRCSVTPAPSCSPPPPHLRKQNPSPGHGSLPIPGVAHGVWWWGFSGRSQGQPRSVIPSAVRGNKVGKVVPSATMRPAQARSSPLPSLGFS